MATFAVARPGTAHGVAPLRLWHLLSLDAPCVAALWTFFLAWQFHTNLPLYTPLALGVAVWMLYAADRIRDAARGGVEQERHRFHGIHQRRLLLAELTAAVVLCVLLVYVPAAVRSGWLLLGVPMLLYAVAVHRPAAFHVPKEPLVAAFFMAATMLPPAVLKSAPWQTMLPAAGCFGAVCWMNCAVIARWEGSLPRADAVTAYLGRHLPASVSLVTLPALVLVARRQYEATALASVSAAMLLLVLDAVREQVEPVTLRALADAALLTPLLVWPLATGLHLR